MQSLQGNHGSAAEGGNEGELMGQIHVALQLVPAVAGQLGLSKTRINELLRELEAAGKVRLHTSRSGTTVALAA
jgi:hypothetical protein